MPGEPPYALAPRRPSRGSTYPPASPLRCPSTELVGSPRRGSLSTSDSGLARMRWYWNINQSSIGYASRPRLRSRLTLGGLTFPRNPWAFGGRAPPPSFATHAGILTSDASTAGLPRRFTRVRTLPYRSLGLDHGGRPPWPSHTKDPAASVSCLSPVTSSAQDHLTSELLRTLSRVAASKPTSWLSGRSHILSHLART